MSYPRPSNSWLSDFREAARHPATIPVVMVHARKPQPASPPRKALKLPISHGQARDCGYTYLTTVYAAEERWMLENVVADMERGGIDYQLVGVIDSFGNHLCCVVRKGITWPKKTIYLRAWRAQRNGDAA